MSILKKLITNGYTDTIKTLVVNESNNYGYAIVKAKGAKTFSKLFWNKDIKDWQLISTT